MDEEATAPPTKFINKIIFIFFGIASLLGWNALLTKLDFFNYFLSDINPFRSFPFLNYILNITFQFLLIWKKKFNSPKDRINLWNNWINNIFSLSSIKCFNVR